MRNVRLTLSYDGTDFVGWQIQPRGRSVQSVVETAIQKLTGETVRVLAAGRTDSGVHALGQVANFRTASRIPCENIRSGLQNFLPHDVIVLHAEDVPLDFHATYSAKSKRYRYIIRNVAVADPFLRRYAWRLPMSLDVDRMQAAATHLLGTHDFRCFESHWPNKATSVRTVTEATVSRQAGWPLWTAASVNGSLREQTSDLCSRSEPSTTATEGSFICFEIVADGFLYNMVRAIVGSLVKIGRGRWEPDYLRQLIANQDRSQAGETAPPQGLYLVHVDY